MDLRISMLFIIIQTLSTAKKGTPVYTLVSDWAPGTVLAVTVLLLSCEMLKQNSHQKYVQLKNMYIFIPFFLPHSMLTCRLTFGAATSV